MVFDNLPFTEGGNIQATTPLDTALDSGAPCSSKDVDNPVNDAGVN